MLFVLPLGQKMTVQKKSILDRDHGHEEPSSAAERETAREPSSVAESAAERGAERDRACVRDHASKVK